MNMILKSTNNNSVTTVTTQLTQCNNWLKIGAREMKER